MQNNTITVFKVGLDKLLCTQNSPSQCERKVLFPGWTDGKNYDHFQTAVTGDFC